MGGGGGGGEVNLYVSAGIKQYYLVDRINLSLTYRLCSADDMGWTVNKHILTI